MAWSRREVEGALGAKALAVARWWMSRKSEDSAQRAGSRLGRAIRRVSKSHRLKVKRNLELAFPEMTPEQREELSVRTFEHWGRFIVEFLRIEKSQEALKSLDKVSVGEEIYAEAFRAGKGVIIVGGHFGRWIPGLLWSRENGIKVNVVVREPNNAGTNKLAQQIWDSLGVETIARGDAAKVMLRKLRNNEMVLVLADQNTDEVFVPFFGKPCGTVMGPAVIAKRSGAALLMSHGMTNRQGRYELRFQKVEALPEYDDPIVGMTAAINKGLEDLVREFPEQYLWLHDRWKSARQRGLL